MALSGGLNFTAMEPLISWDSEKRKFLCCLYRFWDRDINAYKAVFDAVYRDNLRNAGFRDGAPKERLRGQWHHLKSRVLPDWVDVHLSPFDKNGRWAPFIATIRRTLRSLDIRLRENTVDPIDAATYERAMRTLSRRTSSQTQAQDETDMAVDTEGVDEVVDEYITHEIEEEPANVSVHEDRTLCKYGDKECFWCVQERNMEITNRRGNPRLREDGIPPVLYRWSNVDSQGINTKNLLVAGLFNDWDRYFSPNTIRPEKFVEYFRRHVHREEVPSPFISTFKSMLSPVHRAIRNKEGALISVIDTKGLDFVYSARNLFRTHKVRVEKSNYNGAGEFLIWGKVPSSNIICSFKVSTLEQIADEHNDIAELLQLDTIASYKRNRNALQAALSQRGHYPDRTSGNIIGKLLSLLQVRLEYSDEIGRGIFYSWRLRKPGNPGGNPGEAFYEGIRTGYGLSPETPMTADEHQHREVYVISDDEDDDDYDDDDESVTEAGISEDEENERSPASIDDFSYVVVRRGSHGSHSHEQIEANGEMMHIETQCSSYPSSPPCYGDQNETRPFHGSFDQDDRQSAADDDSYVLCNSGILRSNTPRIDDEEETEEEDDDDEAIVKWPRRNRCSYPAIETWDAYTGRWIAQQDELSRQGKGLPLRDVSGARRMFESSDAGSCVSIVSEESDLVATDSVIAAMCDNMEVDTEPSVIRNRGTENIDWQYQFALDRARQRMILG